VARYIERNRYDWLPTAGKLAVFVGFIGFAVFVLYPWRGFLTTFVIVVLSLYIYVSVVTKGSGYRCANCGKVFRVPTAVNFMTTSSVGKNADGTYFSYKQLTCSHCGKRTKARLLKRAEAKGAGTGNMLK
jgi:hypothetical protein